MKKMMISFDRKRNGELKGGLWPGPAKVVLTTNTNADWTQKHKTPAFAWVMNGALTQSKALGHGLGM